MFNLFVADQIELNANAPNASAPDKALFDAHKVLLSNLVWRIANCSMLRSRSTGMTFGFSGMLRR
jgi:hypothetical protein